MYYLFESKVVGNYILFPPDISECNFFVRKLFTLPIKAKKAQHPTQKGTIRTMSKYLPIRGALEVKEFSRQQLIEKFANPNIQVMSLALILFINSFSLYRNMYRCLIGQYFILASLLFIERARRTNVFPFTLGLHSSNIEDVVATIAPMLQALNYSELMTILGSRQVIVCTFLLYYISDMPQQQENSSMKTQRTTISCRFCYYLDTQRRNLQFDIIVIGRYYYEYQEIRKHLDEGTASNVNKKGKRKAYAQQYSLDLEQGVLALKKVSPVLDVILTRPLDLAHSKYNSISQLLHSLLINSILTPKASRSYTKILQNFLFPPSQARL